jgi:MYXO-CTERM domain-containing protein
MCRLGGRISAAGDDANSAVTTGADGVPGLAGLAAIIAWRRRTLRHRHHHVTAGTATGTPREFLR